MKKRVKWCICLQPWEWEEIVRMTQRYCNVWCNPRGAKVNAQLKNRIAKAPSHMEALKKSGSGVI